MCGIAGIVSPKLSLDNKEVINKMTDSMAHRGPDGSDYYYSRECMMGHRRLSIIDIEAGKQPMANEDESVLIVYNGEIYNFKEIKGSLEKKHIFKTRCDTEVLVHAYEEYGPELLSILNGMFSFAVWDKNKKLLFIARDRLGIKPLYYTVQNDLLIFGSEIKAILNYPGIKRIPNFEAISSYMTFRTVLGEETFFKGIYSLPPGFYLIYKDGKLTKNQYWKLKFNNTNKDLGENYYLENVEALLKKAVKRRMMSDVPLGAYLSGGLDSSLLVGIMSELNNSPVKTFSVGFEEDGYSELEYAEIVSKRFNTDHKNITFKVEDYFTSLENLIKHKDTPLSIPHEVALSALSFEMKKEITVVLSGEGADELFGGYGRVLRSPMDLKEINFCNRLPKIFQELYLKLHNQGNKLRNSLNVKSDLDYFLEVYNWIPLREKWGLFSDDINNSIEFDKNLLSNFKEIFRETNHLDSYGRFLYFFEKKHLLNLLERLDMMSMIAGIEARVPFVDHELVEFAINIPFKYKMKWKSIFHKIRAGFYLSEKASEWLDINKYLLRRLGKKSLPEGIAGRKKLGFPVPLDIWMKGRMKDIAKEILLDHKTLNRKKLNSEANRIKDITNLI